MALMHHTRTFGLGPPPPPPTFFYIWIAILYFIHTCTLNLYVGIHQVRILVFNNNWSLTIFVSTNPPSCLLLFSQFLFVCSTLVIFLILLFYLVNLYIYFWCNFIVNQMPLVYDFLFGLVFWYENKPILNWIELCSCIFLIITQAFVFNCTHWYVLMLDL